jgi:hypothetical protein
MLTFVTFEDVFAAAVVDLFAVVVVVLTMAMLNLAGAKAMTADLADAVVVVVPV